MNKLPVFNKSLLHPRYWLIWLGIIIIYIIILLPYPIIYLCGIQLGYIIKYTMKYRMHIIRCNIKQCFPNLSKKEQKKLINKNCISIGMAIFETGMAWFWPNRRIKRWCKIDGLNYILQEQKKQKGILLIGIHFLNLELGARIFGIFNPGIGVYRPNNNPLLDWLQTWGRLRSNKNMINRKNIRNIIKYLKNGEIIWYAPDQDYGAKNSIFVPLFTVSQTSTTIGTYILIKITNPILITYIPKRLKYGLGYKLCILPITKKISTSNKIDTIKQINKIIESIILLAPEQYMWLHRRFKTRPPGEYSIYK